MTELDNPQASSLELLKCCRISLAQRLHDLSWPRDWPDRGASAAAASAAILGAGGLALRSA
eukprot:1158748-Pelagomonas_calceolata.AAC.26